MAITDIIKTEVAVVALVRPAKPVLMGQLGAPVVQV